MPRAGGRRRRPINEINMVPFIDVMLVLLIIFMVTAPLMAPSQIELPSVGRAARTPDQVIQVLVRRDGVLELRQDQRSEAATLDTVAQQVRTAQGSRPPATSAVVISADRNVPYETVVRVMDALQRGGVQRVGLAVQTLP